LEQIEKFLSDFEDALKFLSEGNNLQFLEQATNNFVLLTGKEENVSSYITYQVQLHQILGFHTMPILSFLKGEVNFEGFKSKNMTAYRRLELLKKVCSVYIVNAEKSLAMPNFLNYTFFSINDMQPNQVNMSLINNDSSTFKTSLDFNSGLNLMNQLLNNFEQKLHRGNNQIDMKLVGEYKKFTDEFNSRLEEVLQGIKASQESNQVK